jgi:DNA polymerase-3 subunit gamma/tau
MLGAIDQSYLYELLRALIAGDAGTLLNIARQMESRSIGFESALNDLAALLHLLAVAQHSPQAIADDHPESQTLLDLAASLTADMLQLYYQICILGHRDIGLAPDAYAGFTMTLLRMLAFKADAMAPATPAAGNSTPQDATSSRGNTGGGARAALAQSRQMNTQTSVSLSTAAITSIEQTPAATKTAVSSQDAVTAITVPVLPEIEQIPQQAFSQTTALTENTPLAWDGNWRALVENHLSKLGLVRALAQNCELVNFEGDEMTLRISEAHKHLASANYLEKLDTALNSHFGRRLKLNISTGQEVNTPARQLAVEKAELQDQATQAIMNDRFVQGLMQDMGATIVPNSIKPLH